MFRFTIRDLLWLMVVVGMGIVWLLSVFSLIRIDSRRSYATMKEMQYRVEEISRLHEAIRKAGLRVNQTIDVTVSVEPASE
jgi:hypothetical protein